MVFKDGSNTAMHATILGIPVVTIPLADYADLLASKRDLAVRTINHECFRNSRRSLIERNPEVAIFIAQRVGTEPVSAIVKSARRQFGKARTPSAKAVYRYWTKIRKEASVTPD